VNLPNSLTVGRIVAAPLVAWLAIVDSWVARAVAFVLFIVVAVTDYWDGKLARDRAQVTKLGALLDPLADKLLVISSLLVMIAMDWVPAWVVAIIVAALSIGALVQLAQWEDWINVILGAWLFISPWVYGYTGTESAAWNSYIVGALIFFIGLWGVSAARRMEMLHPQIH